MDKTLRADIKLIATHYAEALIASLSGEGSQKDVADAHELLVDLCTEAAEDQKKDIQSRWYSNM